MARNIGRAQRATGSEANDIFVFSLFQVVVDCSRSARGFTLLAIEDEIKKLSLARKLVLYSLAKKIAQAQ